MSYFSSSEVVIKSGENVQVHSTEEPLENCKM